MSSSDYTNLRRLRHVYYPALTASHSHNNVPHVLNMTPVRPCYTEPPCMMPPNYYDCPPTPPPYCYYPTYHPPDHPPAQPHDHTPVHTPVHTPIHSHPHVHTPVHTDESATTACETTTTCCNNATQHHHHYTTTTTTADNHQDTPVDNHSCTPVDTGVSDTTITTITIKKYYIQPQLNASIIFTVGKNLQFAAEFKVICSSDSAPSNYFEGIIHSYDPTTGEITLYQLQSINGVFDTSNKYRVTIVPGYQEVDRLKDKLERLYLEVFKINIGEGNTNIISYGAFGEEGVISQTSDYFNYFFNEEITIDNDYELTAGFISKKIDTLYEYFFNSSSTALNINNNDVAIETLTDKIVQLNLYFFGISGLVENMTN